MRYATVTFLSHNKMYANISGRSPRAIQEGLQDAIRYWLDDFASELERAKSDQDARFIANDFQVKIEVHT